MPWGIERIYENRGQFLQEQNRALVQENKPEGRESAQGRDERGERPQQARANSAQNPGENRAEGNRGEGRGERRSKRDDSNLL